MKKKTGKNDIILIAVIAACGIIAALILLFTHRTGKMVRVSIDGEIAMTFSLSDNVTYEITGSGGGKNLLVIRDGYAWIEEADCPDGLCRNMGKISLTGQSVVCLPHRVVVDITDDSSGSSGDDADVYVK